MKFSLKFAVLILVSVTIALADGHVKVLTSTDFSDTVAERPTLVKFYTHWCGHSRAMAPEYEKAAEELKDEDLYIAEVDCTEEQALCGQYGVQGYPTVKLFSKDGRVSDYNKARTADAIVEFMKQSIPALSELDATKFDSWNEEQKLFVVGYTAAPTGPVYTALKETADALRNDYVFGVIHDKKLAEKHGVKSVPAIVLYKQFDEKKIVFPQNVDTLLNQKASDESIYTVEHVTKFVKVNSVPLMFGAATMENVKNTIQDAVTSFSPFGRVTGFFKGAEKHISVQYQHTRFKVEVSALQTVQALIDGIEAKFKLVVPIDYIYKWEDGYAVRITDLQDLEGGCLYLIKTVNDTQPVAPLESPRASAPVSPEISFSSMEEFYDALRARGSDEEDVMIISVVFQQQRVNASVLSRLTNEKLKECGLVQVGLRIAVLAVLGK